MLQAPLRRSELLTAENTPGDILRLPIEARFAREVGLKPVCSFIWDQAPRQVEVNGHTVAVHELGPPGGVPVLSFHGNPGSGRGPHPTPDLLEQENIRLIAFDAPGFGESEPVETDTPLIAAGQAAMGVIEALGHEKVAVFARSGGVPRALGFAALYPENVSNMILIAGSAPPTADIDWQAGMGGTSHNPKIFMEVLGTSLTPETPLVAIDELFQIVEGLKQDEAHLMNDIWLTMSDYDKLIFELQPDLLVATAAGHAAGLFPNHTGWKQYTVALGHEWGFELSDIKTPTLIMRGTEDPYVGREHSSWLQKNINGAELLEIEGGHFANWLQIRKQLAYLRERHVEVSNGVRGIGKYCVASSVDLEVKFKLSNSYDNYA